MSAFHRLSGLGAVPASLRGGLVAIGNFDGFHRGHQTVFRALTEKARRLGVPALVMTFEPHPRDVFAPEPFLFRLTLGDAKARLAEALGLDGIIIQPFDRPFADLEAEAFIDDLLVKALGARGVVIGEDFRFGKMRRGTPQMLVAEGARRGFEVEVVTLAGDEGDEAYSSNSIRYALRNGALEQANHLLGYRWFIEGEVIHGDAMGRELGYPTANIEVPAGFDLAQGVYAVRALCGDRLLDGVASYGRPMFDNRKPPFEPHFFDFSGDLYSKHITVALIARIRGQDVFSGLDELIVAMDRDSRQARDRLQKAFPIGPLDEELGFFPNAAV